MSKLIIFVAFVLIPSIAFAYSKDGTTYTTDGSYSDVNSAMTDADEGDTINLPAGGYTWSSQLTITKAITIHGEGLSSTTITHNYSGHLIYINPGSDKAIRLTGIYFTQSTNNSGYTTIYINGNKSGSYALTQLRIDHCKIEKGSHSIYSTGWVEGVIDNNQFLNNNISIMIVGDDGEAWDLATDTVSGGKIYQAGTSHALFIEDNTFTITNDADREPNELIYHQEAGRTVTRYNTFDASTYTDGDALFFDSHGNQNYYDTGDDAGTFRGQPIIEIYENSFHCYQSYRMMHIRGGSMLLYSNSFNNDNGSSVCQFNEEEAWSTTHFETGLDSTWPAEDQVANTFIWSNTGDLSVTINGSSTTFVQEDRDYFLHQPQSSGGYSYYDDRMGAAGNASDGTLNWSSSGANAYYPYTAYTYPHPLVGGDSTPPVVTGYDPAKSETGVNKDTNIEFIIYDATNDVDLDTIVMTEESNYHCCSDMVGTCPGSGAKDLTCTDYSVLGDGYTVVYNPGTDYSYEQIINVTIDADDDQGNSMDQDSYSFTIESAPSELTNNGSIMNGCSIE